MKIIVKLSLLTIFAVCLYAQTYAQNRLSESHQEFVQRRAAQKTAQMNNYIAYMVDEGYPMSVREEYMQSAKDLFVGRAETYYEEGYSRIANMQVTSISRPTPKTYPVKTYFKSLLGLIKKGVYDCAKINTTDIQDMQVSSLRHLYDNVYECTVSYVQVFHGYKDGRAIYGPDRTKKNIKCIVYFISDQEGGYELAVYLSDCHATETKKIDWSLVEDNNILIPDR